MHTLETLALDIVKPDPNQPRKAFDDAELADLAASIKADGLLQPIVVRPNGQGYYIVDGERRYRAASLAGLASIDAIVREDLVSTRVKADRLQALQLVANIQRADLTLPEQINAVGALVRDLGFEQACKALGKSAAWVSKRANALKLPEKVKKVVLTGKVRDIEVASSLGELHEVDPKEAEFIAGRIAKGDGEEYGRAYIADSVRRAKMHLKHEQELAERRAAEKAAAAKKEGGKPKVSAAEEKARERQRKIDAVKEARKELRTQCLGAIYAGLKIDPKKQDAFDAPVAVDYYHSDFNSWNPDSKFPATAAACRFGVAAHGDVSHLKKVASGFSKTPMVDVDLPKLTLAQAQAVEAALKGVKDCRFGISCTITGKDLTALATKLGGKIAAPTPAAKKPATAKKARK